jgi:hypothetical protein
MFDRDQAIMELTGKPGVYSYGVIAPSFWGRTTLQLQPTRLVEKTHKLIFRRHCSVLLSQVDSAEIVEEGNPLWILLGVMTLWIFVGVLFFVLYFLFKHKYLAVRSGNNVQLVMLDSINEVNAEQFMNTVLQQAEGLQPKQL